MNPTQPTQIRSSDLEPGLTWQQVLARKSFAELDARRRAFALLDDDGTARELCGPFDRLESPWLEPQGVVPQADDGVVIVKGALAGAPTVVIAVEQAFQGGGIGEVSGAKMSAALSLAARDSRDGTPTAAVLLMETGGVRLQEANLGLAAVAEICSAVLDLRPLSPVIAVIAGPLGCFGGISIATALCTEVIMTHGARLGLNGPDVIESEAGIAEFDAHDRALIWSIDGGATRVAIGQADQLVVDDVTAVRAATAAAVKRVAPKDYRSQNLSRAQRRLDAIDPASRPSPEQLVQLWKEADR
jgi:malonate decarboxylase beta subunit